MHHPARLTLLRRRTGLLLVPVLALTAGLCLAQSPPHDQGRAKLRADCRLEGEAGGLSGPALDQFVDQCITDLLSVEIHNLVKD